MGSEGEKFTTVSKQYQNVKLQMESHIKHIHLSEYIHIFNY